MKKFIPKFIFNIYHFLLALLGAIIYDFPSRKLIIVGVTGTKGKSTVVHLITEILEKTGKKVSSLSSIRFKIADKEWKNMLKMTMPGRLKLQKFLRDAVNRGCKYMILEVTSEGIKQHRHRFIEFNGAVFTNLTKEHVEAHKGFENYKKAKGKLFKALQKNKKKDKFAVINADDKYGKYYAKLAGNVKKYKYSLKNPVKTSLIGEFNKYNALAALNTVLALGIDKEKALKIIENFKEIPGRMELVIKEPFKVFVDYAHTPDSLENVYKTISKLKNQNSSLICLLGSCGGGRDKWKRPLLGKLADEYCDEIIVTNEDPYDENPNKIINDVAAGCKNKKPEKILDRREAINKALTLAREDDILAITGKGCEPWMCVANGKRIAWDDRRIVKEEFEKITTNY